MVKSSVFRRVLKLLIRPSNVLNPFVLSLSKQKWIQWPSIARQAHDSGQTEFRLHRAESIVALSLLCIPSALMAATWQQQVNVPVSLQYDTNPLMQETNISAIWKSTVNPRYSLTAIQDLDRWNADFTLRVERNSDQNVAINREDPSIGLGWRHDFEKGQFGVRLGYDKSSSRASTIDETGRASGGDSTRVGKSMGLDLQVELTDRLSISSSANVSRMTFQGVGASAGSRSYAATAALNYAYSEHLQPYLQFTANRSESDDTLVPATNVYGAVIGANWSLLERLSLNGNWGYNQVTGASSGRDWRATGNFAYAFKRSSLTLAASRAISPSANGGFISSDQISGGWRYELTDRSSVGVDASMRKNHGVGKTETDQFTTWYARDLNPDWNLKVSYLYKQSSGTDMKVHGSVLGLFLGYSFFEF